MTGAPAHPAARGGPLRLLHSLLDVRHLATDNPRLTGLMLYRAKEAGVPADPDRIAWAALDDISPYLVCALVRAEDPVFFRHRGIGWTRMREAIREARREGKPVRGVSTITQQLARNLYLHPDRSLRRKIQEALVARRLEGVLSKARILELYLNVIEWGDGTWGAGAAARAYFSRTPAELDAFQAVVLASMVPAPRRPLRDGNARRALGVQKQLAADFYACGILSRAGEHEVRKRIVYLEACIKAGEPAERVLRRLAEMPPAPPLSDPPPVTTRALIAEECRLERWRQFMLFLRRSAQQRRPIERLPMWWTGEGEPAVADAGTPA